MGVKIWVNKGHVYLSLCYGGRQWREGTGLTIPKTKALEKEVMKLAEAMRAKREMEMAAGQAGMLSEEMRRISLYDYAVKKAPERKGLLLHLEAHGARSVSLVAVSRRWLERFQQLMLESGLAPSSAEVYSIYLRTVLKKATLEGYFTTCPYDGVPHIKAKKHGRVPLSVDEVKALYATDFPGVGGEDIKRAFFFSCLTGLRVSDLQSLRLSDIDRGKHLLIKKIKKTGETIYIPLSEEAEKLLGTEEIVFPYLASQSELTASTSKRMKAWAARAGVKKNISWHTARHTAATLMLEAGADVYTVQHVLGHRSLKTTEIYAEVVGKTKRKAVEALADLLKK